MTLVSASALLTAPRPARPPRRPILSLFGER